MKTYLYIGVHPHLSTIIVDKKEMELRLFEGSEYILPEHPTVAALVAQGLLVEKNSVQKQKIK